MAKVEMSPLAKARQEEYRRIYRTWPEPKGYSTWDEFLSYVKMGILAAELPLIMYYILRDIKRSS